MSPNSTISPEQDIEYPYSDGQPMAENMFQWEWIVLLKLNIDRLLKDRQPALVGSDNFVYPVKGEPKIVVAPDVYVAIGRPNYLRMSYKVWEEDGIFPQVVMEVMSPGNDAREMELKRQFYERYGAEEFFIVNPDDHTVKIYTRQQNRLLLVSEPYSFVSPRLGIRFLFDDNNELVVMGPDGQAFYKYDEANNRIEQEAKRADQEATRADLEATKRAKLAAKLRELGIDPDTV